jgi:hypothetical protein
MQRIQLYQLTDEGVLLLIKLCDLPPSLARASHLNLVFILRLKLEHIGALHDRTLLKIGPTSAHTRKVFKQSLRLAEGPHREVCLKHLLAGACRDSMSN